MLVHTARVPACEMIDAAAAKKKGDGGDANYVGEHVDEEGGDGEDENCDNNVVDDDAKFLLTMNTKAFTCMALERACGGQEQALWSIL